MNIVFLDLELNKTHDEDIRESKTTDIIQIGAAILDTSTGTIIDTFSRFCNLSTRLDSGELRLSKFIVKLTGITDEQINSSGIPLEQAYNELIAWIKKHEASRIVGTWGSGDLDCLRSQLPTNIVWHFSRFDSTGYYDVKKMFQSYQIINNAKWQGGLRKAINVLDIQLDGKRTYHNAEFDAIMTAKVYYYLVSKWRKNE